MENLPWLDYTGQTTPELIACKSSHSIASLLCAFELGIQAKAAPHGDGNLTAEEQSVLAVMALHREVNNGGYSQFFVNPSCRFVPIIVDALLRIQSAAAAAITRRAIAALRLPALSGPARDEILNACDQEFYRLNEIEPKLFGFIEAHQDRIELVQASLPPPRPSTPAPGNAAVLVYAMLLTAKHSDPSPEAVRQLAQALARQNSIPATDAELDGAAALYSFRKALRADDIAACEILSARAFGLMRGDASHCVLHRQWVQWLIAASRHQQADAATLAYLEYLKGCGPSTLPTENRILYWAALLQEQRTALPQSVEFFAANFPGLDLGKPLPAERFQPIQRPANQ